MSGTNADAAFGTFEDYCRGRWAMTDGRARQLIGAARLVQTVTTVAPDTPVPANEAQVRALNPVAEPDRPAVWREAWLEHALHLVREAREALR